MANAMPSDPAYLKAAFADLGLSEIRGSRHNARVLQLFTLAGHPEIKDDETAWCAAAVGGWLKQSGYPNTGSLMARSYARYGKPCDLSKPLPRGAIVVWPRGAPPSGHVNICIDDDGTHLTCIGGNQSNGKGGGVTVTRDAKSRALAARLPHGLPIQPKKPVEQDAEDDSAPIPLPPDIPSRPEPDDKPAPQPGLFARIRNWVGGMFASGGLFYMDWRLGAAIIVGLFLLLLFMLWLFGREKIKAWLKRHLGGG